ncbi:hypothetical protein VSR68_10200 [Paraburkholderia phymatum]|uniref:hypothetical protein n=1 Tax=Paraburkholderia phymatum TaxID=148447 RepID=UPI003181FDB9
MKISSHPTFKAAVADPETDPTKRMRKFGDVKYAVNNAQEVSQALHQSRVSAQAAAGKLAGLQEQQREARGRPTFAKSAGRKVDHEIAKLEKQQKDATAESNRLEPMHEGTQLLKADWNRAAVSKARNEWGPSGAMHQNNPMRALGAGKDVSAWSERNAAGGAENKPRPVRHGEMLDVKDGWTDYINQGWMQGGYDNKAAFRLLTPLGEASVKQHNAAADKGTWNGYEDHLKREGQKIGPSKNNFLFKSDVGRPTWYAHELADLAKNGYAIRKDENGRQVAMPKEKANVLNEITREVPKVD